MTIANITQEYLNKERRKRCEDGMYFNRYFFKQRMGAKLIVSPHHDIIQKTLEKVVAGEITRLVINIPPGYTKTEFASIGMMAHGLSINPRARFLHLSYSHSLALLNSSTARNICKSKAYQDLWPMKLRDDSDSKAMWWTEQGGGVYATSSAGQVTGFRAGHMEDGFTGALIIDDPVKPDDAFSEVMREGVNNRYNETIASRVAVETVPIIVVMQRIHYNDLSGYLLRGGSGEKWHHLNLPVIIDNSKPYPSMYTHGIPIEHNLPDGWLWPFKHNEEHRTALESHRRKFQAQYMQEPVKFDAEGALWRESMISTAQELDFNNPIKTYVAVDPAVTSEANSDETGIVVCSQHKIGKDKRYSVDGDYSGRYTPNEWANAAIRAYNKHNANAIVIEVNQGGDMAESVLRNSGYKGKVIKVRAAKGKFARAEPVAALYEQDFVSHKKGLYELETQLLEYVPSESKYSPDRLDALVWGITELAGLNRSGGAILTRR